jgi:hypothetical protein
MYNYFCYDFTIVLTWCELCNFYFFLPFFRMTYKSDNKKVIYDLKKKNTKFTLLTVHSKCQERSCLLLIYLSFICNYLKCDNQITFSIVKTNNIINFYFSKMISRADSILRLIKLGL